MTRLLILIIIIGSVYLPINCLANEQSSAHVKLVFAANMPDIALKNSGGYSHLYTLLEQTRKKDKNTIFAFGGGSLGPSPMSSFDQGSHIIDILNTLEPDLMTARKREFSYFEDELSLRSFEAAFPIIVSNLTDQFTGQNLEGLLENIVIEKNGRKIGFMSILETEALQEYILTRVKIIESRAIIEQQAKILRQQGAEVVVMFFSKKQPYYIDLLDSGTIDMAIIARAARDNARLNTISHPRVYSLTKNERALIFDLTWSAQKPHDLHIHQSEVELNEYAQNPIVADQISDYSNRLNRLLNQKIGLVTTELNTLQKSVRTEENAFANFVVDAIKDHEKAEIGFINGGAIRGDKIYPANTVLTRRDIATELPFRSRITLVLATGQQLKEALEYGVSEVELIRGRFPQVSGLEFSYSSSLPAGKRVTKVTHNGNKLDLTRNYTVATSSYIANGGDGYTSLSNKIVQDSLETSQPLLSDIVILNIQKVQNITPKLGPRSVRLK